MYNAKEQPRDECELALSGARGREASTSSPRRAGTETTAPSAGDEPGGPGGVGARHASTHRSPGQLIGWGPDAAGRGGGSLASRARTVGAPVAPAASAQWPSQGEEPDSARAGRAWAGDLLPPPGPEASWPALGGRVGWPGAVRPVRSLSPSLGCRGEAVSRDAGLFGRDPGRVGHQGRRGGDENGAADRFPLGGPCQAGATDRAHGV